MQGSGHARGIRRISVGGTARAGRAALRGAVMGAGLFLALAPVGERERPSECSPDLNKQLRLSSTAVGPQQGGGEEPKQTTLGAWPDHGSCARDALFTLSFRAKPCSSALLSLLLEQIHTCASRHTCSMRERAAFARRQRARVHRT